MPPAWPSRDSACEERPLEVLAERRLPRHQPGCSIPIDGVMIDWWAPPSGASVTPRGRADEDRLPARVDAVRPRLERAGDERVVDRADRQQRLAPARPRRAQLAEQADEVDLGDAELDVLAVVGLAPAHQRVGVVGEPVDRGRPTTRPGLVDPAAEVGRRRHVGRDGDHARRDRGRRRGRGRRRSARTPAAWTRGPRARARGPRAPRAGATGARLARRRRRAAASHSSASAEPGSNGAHGSPASAPSSAARWANWSRSAGRSGSPDGLRSAATSP